MSYIDYRYSQSQLGAEPRDELGKRLAATWRNDPPFYGVVMVAMRRADTSNLAKLLACWPEVWEELQARYNAPGAVLASDPLPLVRQVAESLGVEVEELREASAAAEGGS